jgi:BlaI family transcriptional regulator, penicillinase repressor
MIKREPSKLEMQVLSVLWQRGPSSVRDVLDAMPDGKSRAYTTILTVMQVMEKKGLVSHTAQGNTHIYAAAISRDQVAGPLLKDLVRHLFGGSRVTALQHLLQENEVTPGELDEIKQLIANHEKEGSSRRKKRS